MVETVHPDILRNRRLTWIRALEGDTYRQGGGSLFRQDIDRDSKHETPIQGTSKFCCLGVARDVPTAGAWSILITEEEADDTPDYNWVTEFYGIPEKLRFYLMGMNDGDRVVRVRTPTANGSNFALAWYPGTDNATMRAADDKRDFPFIARYLRKVWGLTGA